MLLFCFDLGFPHLSSFQRSDWKSKKMEKIFVSLSQRNAIRSGHLPVFVSEETFKTLDLKKESGLVVKGENLRPRGHRFES